jgi:hypothetical protein
MHRLGNLGHYVRAMFDHEIEPNENKLSYGRREQASNAAEKK